MDFWSEAATGESWRMLQSISKEFEFTLIGGWAVFLWTRQHKSKDIDLVVDLKTLDFLKKNYPLQKNDRLRKYEIKQALFDVDIYVPHYSSLALPLEEVVSKAQSIEGFNVASVECLLVLKQGAWLDRRNSVKGRKDAIDVLSLLMHAPFNAAEYEKLLENHGKENYARELVGMVQGFDVSDLKFVDSNVHAFKKWKTSFLTEIKKIQ